MGPHVLRHHIKNSASHLGLFFFFFFFFESFCLFSFSHYKDLLRSGKSKEAFQSFQLQNITLLSIFHNVHHSYSPSLTLTVWNLSRTKRVKQQYQTDTCSGAPLLLSFRLIYSSRCI